MKGRAGIVVRLSAAELDTAGNVASEIGAPLERLFSACALDVASDSTSVAVTGWGAPPGRFAAAELLHIDLSPDELAKLERAAKDAFFTDSAGRKVPMNVPQFVSRATFRSLERARGDRGILQRLVSNGSAGTARAEPSSRSIDRSSSPETGRFSAVRERAPEPPSRPRESTPARSSSAARARAETRETSSSRRAKSGALPEVVAGAEAPNEAHGLSKNDLRLAVVVGAVTVVSLIGAIVYFGSKTKAPKPVVVVKTVHDRTGLPPVKPIKLPPAKHFTPEELKQMRAELATLTSKFHTQNSASKRVDTLLRNIYGRPRVAQVGLPLKPPTLLSVAPYDRKYDADILTACDSVASIHTVPPALVKGIIRRESNFNPKAVSTTGAIGLMQLMPFNAKRVGLTVQDLWDPAKNILAGTRLIAVLLKFYHGDVISALVAYNAKPRDLFASVPRNGETPGYVAAVLANYQAYAGKPLREQLDSTSQNTASSETAPPIAAGGGGHSGTVADGRE